MLTNAERAERPPFRYVSEQAEPHRARRQELLRRHPELRRLYGYSYATSIVMLAIVLAQLAIALWVQHEVDRGSVLGSPVAIVLLAYFVGATLNHWAGMGIHEASHDLAARSRLANRVIALVANVPIVVPSAMSFRRHHLKHHSHLGVPGADNDLSTAFEIRAFGRSRLRKLLWLALYPFFASGARGFLGEPSRWEWINIATQLVANVVIWKLIGGAGLAYLGISTVLGFGLLHPTAAHFIHEHYIWKEGQETYSYYGPLNWVTFNVGYHNEHHDLMQVPCWKLPEVRRAAPEMYGSMVAAQSWIAVLYEFVMNPTIGHDSRVVRSHARRLIGRSGEARRAAGPATANSTTAIPNASP